MEYKDYYAALGVNKDATQDDIKRAFKKLARKYHPDLNKQPGAEEKFKEIGEAHEVLGDPEKRAAYDQLGQGWQPGQEFRPPPDWDTGFEFSGGFSDSNDGEAAFSDFFESLFARSGHIREPHFRPAGRTHQRGPARGEDHHARVMVDLEDAVAGAKRSIQLTVPKVTPDGHVVTERRTLNVTIPKGIRPGQHIRLKGQGTPAISMPGMEVGEPGDLYLEVVFQPHELYRVEGGDLFLDLPVSPWEAALGGKVTVPTPAGPVDVTIPANSAQGRKLRLKGRGLTASTASGIATSGSGPGDLYIVLKVVLPPADNEKAKRFYRTMAEELAFDPRAGFGRNSMAGGRDDRSFE